MKINKLTMSLAAITLALSMNSCDLNLNQPKPQMEKPEITYPSGFQETRIKLPNGNHKKISVTEYRSTYRSAINHYEVKIKTFHPNWLAKTSEEFTGYYDGEDSLGNKIIEWDSTKQVWYFNEFGPGIAPYSKEEPVKPITFTKLNEYVKNASDKFEK